MNSITIFICCLASFVWTKNNAEGLTEPKIDFTQLEFENLESKTARDDFVKNLESYEIAYPVALEKHYKLTENHKRLRRGITDSRISNYQINAFGKNVEIELQNSESILPGMSIEYHKADGIQRKLLSDNSCFRVGRVTNINGSSSVAISDCDGLAGLVKTSDDLFFIEPMKVKSNDKASRHRPHLIYRTKDLPSYSYEDYVSRASMDQVLQAPNPSTVYSSGNRSSRVKRDAWDSFITVVNKARRSVELHWLDLFGRRKYFETLRPNQRRSINTYANTKWIGVDDSTKKEMMLNGKKQFLATRNSESNRVIVTVTSSDDISKDTVTSNRLMGDDHWIEALIVADESIVAFHGKDKVEKYLLVLSNMISLIMKDPSIGVRLNFVLTRLVILQRKEAKLTIYTKNPSQSVRSACSYAASIQKSRDDDHADHHDFALILTKHKFGPAGYAPVDTMCSERRSCALVDDSGFGSAFIAAHEAGHTLGLGHDGDENNCKEDSKRGSIMASLVVSRLTKFHWSKCSRKTIQQNLIYFTCLDDRPHPKDFKYLKSLPGVYATVDEQCGYVLGRRYKKCEYYGIKSCRSLWCSDTSGQSFSCTTRRRPPLDGTYCGTDKWCVKGKCVPSDIPSTRPTPIDGKWSQWSDWNQCSLSCGTGVRYKTRKCDNPKPAHGGKACEGKTHERETCNTQKCSITKKYFDLRNEQCKLFAGDDFSLYTDAMFSNRFKKSRHTLDCTFQDGLCNWIQGTSDKFDWRVNNGRTPSAETGPRNDHNGNSNGKYVFIEASDNRGARRQMGDTARLVSPEVGVPQSCLKFYYHMYGTHMGTLRVLIAQSGNKEKVLWKKSGNQGNLWFKADVSIQSAKPYKIILEAVRGAHYTSDVSIDSLVFRAGLCEKEAAAKNPCTVSCVSGDKRQFLLDKAVLDGSRCYGNKSHDICLNGACEVYGCDNKFGSTKVFDDCNVCGGDSSTCNAVEGTKDIVPKREYEKILDLGRDTTNFVLEERDSSPYRIGLRVPGSVKETYLAARKGHGYHSIGGATLYFANLEDGRQMISSVGPFKQDVEAVLYTGGTTNKEKRRKAELSFKFFEKKNDRRNYKYEVDQWGQCSKSCDTGTQTATLKCVRNKKTDVALRYCSHLKKNEIIRACNVAACKTLYKWILLPWSRCSAKCGSGRQRRVVACVLRKQNKIVHNKVCPPPYPENWRYCNTQPCVTYEWAPEPWGKCSKSCSGGLQFRDINCVESVSRRQSSAKLCKKSSPAKVRACNLQECDTFRYKTAAVGKCSKTCGGGLRVKIVYCINKRTGGRVGNLFCTGPPPPRIEKCKTDLCPHYEWTTGKFGACSQTCDGGERRRRVYCLEKQSKREVADGLCKDAKPADSEYCDNPPCSSYLWQKGLWSTCDALCGEGVQNRTVRCLMEGTRAVSPESRCRATLKKPRESQTCRVKDCASEASLSCNFEDNHFCNWNNEQGDDFNWKLGRSTPTLTTGPDRDHTTKRGKFAYIETSSPRLSRDRAFLASPMVNLKGGCFSFWYHMKGSGMGRLFVFLVNEANYKKKLYLKDRHQGDHWKRANIPIPKNTPKGYKILIIGEKGTSFLSDIALDDISYSKDDCPSSCIERSPLCVVVNNMEQYCLYPAFKKLCCETCSKVR